MKTAAYQFVAVGYHSGLDLVSGFCKGMFFMIFWMVVGFLTIAFIGVIASVALDLIGLPVIDLPMAVWKGSCWLVTIFGFAYTVRWSLRNQNRPTAPTWFRSLSAIGMIAGAASVLYLNFTAPF